MRAPIDGTQRRMRIEAFRASDTAITEGTQRGTFTDNGTGDFTITLTEPYGRTPVVTASAQHATLKLYVSLVSSSTTAVRLVCYDEGGVARDPTSFNVTFVGSDSADGQI